MMKRLLTFLFAFILAIGVGWAESVTFTPSDYTAVSNADYTLQNAPITIAVTVSTVTGEQFRIYKNQTLTVSAEEGYTITGVEFTCTASGTVKYGPGCFTADLGSYTYSGYVGTWTGSASEIVFTASTNQVRATQIVVTYSNGGTTTVAAPTITPSTTGTVDDALETAQTISMSTTTSGASIYYTTDGTTPSATNGTEYTGAFILSQSATVKAIAILNGTSSSVTSQTYYIRVPVTFTFSPASGTSLDAGTQNITVTLSDADHDWRVYYTTNGDDPTGSDVTTYYSTSNGMVTIPVTITAGTTTTLWVAAYRTDDPTGSSTSFYYFGDESATYTGNQGGGTSSGGYVLYSGNLTEGDYVIVYDEGAMKAAVSSNRLGYENVTINNNVVENPDASLIWHIAPSGDYWTIYNAGTASYAASTGTDNRAQLLADGTDDKSLWSVSGTATYEFVNKNNSASDINANLRRNTTYGFACYSTSTGGALSLYKYVQSAPTVTATPEGGEVEYGTTVTLTSNPQGATIHYTTDGTEPTASSPTYSAPIAITGDMTIKAMAVSGEETGEVAPAGLVRVQRRREWHPAERQIRLPGLGLLPLLHGEIFGERERMDPDGIAATSEVRGDVGREHP